MFHRRARFALVLITTLGALGGTVHGQTVVATLSANLGSLAKLSFSTNSLSFPDANPDLVPQVPSTPPAITITAKARAARLASITLTVVASADLRSGVNTIAASNLTWTASGPGFVGGTLSAATPQIVASWSASGNYVGTQQFQFRNLWTHPTGTYTLTLLYTLTSP